MSSTRLVVKWDGSVKLNRVMLVARPVALKVMFAWIEVAGRTHQFCCKVEAVFPYSQYPELVDAHDGCSWNLDVIQEFLSSLILTDLPSGLMALRIIE